MYSELKNKVAVVTGGGVILLVIMLLSCKLYIFRSPPGKNGFMPKEMKHTINVTQTLVLRPFTEPEHPENHTAIASVASGSGFKLK